MDTGPRRLAHQMMEAGLNGSSTRNAHRCLLSPRGRFAELLSGCRGISRGRCGVFGLFLLFDSSELIGMETSTH